MEDFEKYLDKDERELLSLVRFHLRYIDELNIKHGGLNHSYIEFKKKLDYLEESLKKEAIHNLPRLDRKERPLITQCPDCKITKRRIPIGEEKNDFDFICNLYHCDECDKDYLDKSPNNNDDQKKLAEYFISLIDEREKDLANTPPEFKESVERLKQKHEEILRLCNKSEEIKTLLNNVEQQIKEGTARMRDDLLLAKLKILNPNASKGES